MPFLKPKKKCLMCDAKIKDDNCAEIKYRYADDKVGTAYFCEKCEEEYLKESDLDNEQPV